jgi:hypothetical protein
MSAKKQQTPPEGSELVNVPAEETKPEDVPEGTESRAGGHQVGLALELEQ